MHAAACSVDSWFCSGSALAEQPFVVTDDCTMQRPTEEPVLLPVNVAAADADAACQVTARVG
jgi:hypothetical protein